MAFARIAAIKTISKCRSKYTLPDLPYDYNALEPVVSAEIMQLHHGKHHAAYVNNLNSAMEQFHEAESKQDLNGITKLQKAIRFNGGGHLNHSMFWNMLCPVSKARGEPGGRLAELLRRDFGTFASFQGIFNASTGAIQGSGWGWLGWEPNQGRLAIACTANQDSLFGATGLIPLLGVDVWEHAYYLQYKNVRPDYLKAIWSIINWDDVAQRLADCEARNKQ